MVHGTPVKTLAVCLSCVGPQDAGVLRAFGSIDLDVIPTKSPGVMPETKLTELTGMDMKSLSPSRRTGTWAFAVS